MEKLPTRLDNILAEAGIEDLNHAKVRDVFMLKGVGRKYMNDISEYLFKDRHLLMKHYDSAPISEKNKLLIGDALKAALTT